MTHGELIYLLLQRQLSDEELAARRRRRPKVGTPCYVLPESVRKQMAHRPYKLKADSEVDDDEGTDDCG